MKVITESERIILFKDVLSVERPIYDKIVLVYNKHKDAHSRIATNDVSISNRCKNVSIHLSMFWLEIHRYSSDYYTTTIYCNYDLVEILYFDNLYNCLYIIDNLIGHAKNLLSYNGLINSFSDMKNFASHNTFTNADLKADIRKFIKENEG